MNRQPIARRIMVALFLSMMAPMFGWYFLDESVRPSVAPIFLISLFVFGANVVYLRRSVLDPLRGLAQRAQDVERWTAPPDLDRPDEIGDLARALHGTIRTLDARAREAVDFAACLSHELRTPLTAIRGAIEMMGEELEPEDRERFAANVLAESERLERMVLGVLDMERARRQEQEEHQSCDASEIAASVLEASRPLFARKQLRAEFIGEPTKVAISSDRSRRILISLLENAIKFSPRGGRIRVSVREEGAMVHTTVEDEGPGVAPGLRREIFSRSFRGKDRGGTGLGLAIVKSLVESGGGQVWVEDAEPPGARFTYGLPRARDRSLSQE